MSRKLAPLWLHRASMIAMLPIAIIGVVPLGILYGFVAVYEGFARHWKDHP